MKAQTLRLPSDAIILPIGDLHIGDNNCDVKAIKNKVDFAEENENAYIFINGDIVNCAVAGGASSTHDQKSGLSEQIQEAVSVFSSVKDRIIGVTSGNHDQRLEKIAGMDAALDFCGWLGIPDKFCGYLGIVDLRLGENRKDQDRVASNVQYTLVFHHTTGGGSTAGAKLNPIDKLTKIVGNADAYFGSHNHHEAVMKTSVYEYSIYAQKIVERTRWLIDCGGFLKYSGGYPEMKGLPPTTIGSPIARFSSREKEIKVEI